VLGDALVAGRYLWQLPRLLRRPVTTAEARHVVGARLERREEAFLAHVREAIYARPGSPYQALLRLAGCEAGDLEALVRREGLEGALTALLQHGVYPAVEEFRGRRPAPRGGGTVPVSPLRLATAGASAHLLVRTGGSRTGGTLVPIDLAYVRDRAANGRLALDARGGGDWRHAVWGVPGSALLVNLLEYSLVGRVGRWFSPVDPASAALHPRYRWSARLTALGGRLAGRPLPAPEHVPDDDLLRVARWLRAELDAGHTPHLHGYTSAIVRLCQAARAAGLDLAGAGFTCVGESATAARLAAIRATGARAWPRYAALECGPVGFACLAPEAPDDMHLFHDRLAVIQAGAAGAALGLPGDALLVTSLRRHSAPFALLNVSLGDRATLDARACACPLGAMGWTRHLREVRSFEKLTAAGMTVLDADVVRSLEEIRPGHFGGGPADYQLVEEQAPDGRSRLTPVVPPDVGPLDAAALTGALLDALGTKGGARRLASLVWQDAGLVRVHRRPPARTSMGKVQHLHVERTGTEPVSGA
jgi:hypothetical protein